MMARRWVEGFSIPESEGGIRITHLFDTEGNYCGVYVGYMGWIDNGCGKRYMAAAKFIGGDGK